MLAVACENNVLMRRVSFIEAIDEENAHSNIELYECLSPITTLPLSCTMILVMILFHFSFMISTDNEENNNRANLEANKIQTLLL